jgi:hypothetical protein
MMGEANRYNLDESYQSNAPPGMMKRDIEEEDYIYKVPCQARETISLRDSTYVSNQ